MPCESCFGQVFNFKLDRFTKNQVVLCLHTHPPLELEVLSEASLLNTYLIKLHNKSSKIYCRDVLISVTSKADLSLNLYPTNQSLQAGLFNI
jgi:hypothetical protein